MGLVPKGGADILAPDDIQHHLSGGKGGLVMVGAGEKGCMAEHATRAQPVLPKAPAGTAVHSAGAYAIGGGALVADPVNDLTVAAISDRAFKLILSTSLFGSINPAGRGVASETSLTRFQYRRELVPRSPEIKESW